MDPQETWDTADSWDLVTWKVAPGWGRAKSRSQQAPFQSGCRTSCLSAHTVCSGIISLGVWGCNCGCPARRSWCAFQGQRGRAAPAGGGGGRRDGAPERSVHGVLLAHIPQPRPPAHAAGAALILPSKLTESSCDTTVLSGPHSSLVDRQPQAGLPKQLLNVRDTHQNPHGMLSRSSCIILLAVAKNHEHCGSLK